MKKLMKKIMLSCDKATELIEKRIHFKLTFWEKIQLKLHLAFCKPCSHYEKQSYIIEESMSKIKPESVPPEDIKLLKEEIIKKLS